MGALSKGTMVVGVLCFFYGIFPVNLAEGLGFEVWSDVPSEIFKYAGGFPVRGLALLARRALPLEELSLAISPI